VPIVEIEISRSDGSDGTGVFILYEDDQVWYADVWDQHLHLEDVRRLDSSVSIVDISGFPGWGRNLLVSYDDGQMWRYESGDFHRIFQWDREDIPLSIPDNDRDDQPSSIYPNPSVGGCEIAFAVPNDDPFVLWILSASGRTIRRMAGQSSSRGRVNLHWDGLDDSGREVPAGVYLTRVETVEGVKTGRVVIAR
jgi:hypothetical protein